MKKIIVIFLFLIFFFIPQASLAVEKIDNFEVFIAIDEDSSINVEEKITYDFGSAQRHGIYRDIPIEYKARGGRYNLRISNIKVTDEQGDKYNHKISYPGKYARIRIGDPDKLITGSHDYVIKYKIKRAVNFFDNHDELYWNITGNEWNVAIDKAKAVVWLPGAIREEKLKTDCFVGPFGSTENCTAYEYKFNKSQLVNRIEFRQDGLGRQEGLTAIVGLPKGILKEPTIFEKIFSVLKDNWIFGLPVITFLAMFFVWRKYGKDPKGRGTIITQFDAPDELAPVEVGTIVDDKFHKRDISAEIINLAVLRYLKIKRIKGQGLLKSDDYELLKLKDEKDLPNDFDKKLMQGLFGSKDKIKISSLKNKFYKDLRSIKSQVYKNLIDKGYFKNNPLKTKALYIFLGLFLGNLIAVFLASFFGFFGFISGAFSGLIIIIFGIFMTVKTKKGVLAKEYILGLKNYLTVAEKDRLKFHNAPSKDPKHFEELLPFAMALQVEKEWAEQFKSIYDQQPDWYSDPARTGFTSVALAGALTDFNSKTYSTLASRPSSASSGGSGFSGGGSGGGFGGGGGGSW